MRQWWIYKGESNFCSELQFDVNNNRYVRVEPDGFYDVVSVHDTIEGGIHVVERSAYDALSNELAEQCRINGLVAQRELKLKTELAEVKEEREKLYADLIGQEHRLGTAKEIAERQVDELKARLEKLEGELTTAYLAGAEHGKDAVKAKLTAAMKLIELADQKTLCHVTWWTEAKKDSGLDFTTDAED